MEVFHWVAEQLDGMPIFSTEQEVEEKTGSIYNDFDYENPFNSDEEAQINYSFTQPSSPPAATSSKTTSSKPVRRNVENVLDHTFCKLKNFDRYSFNPDKEYRKKVYRLLTEEIANVTFGEDIKEIYEKRYEKGWTGADTVYDLYLIGTARERDWFPIEIFEAEFPDYQEKVANIIESEEKSPKKSKNPSSSASQSTEKAKRKRCIQSEDSNSEDDHTQEKSTEASVESTNTPPSRQPSSVSSSQASLDSPRQASPVSSPVKCLEKSKRTRRKCIESDTSISADDLPPAIEVKKEIISDSENEKGEEKLNLYKPSFNNTLEQALLIEETDDEN